MAAETSRREGRRRSRFLRTPRLATPRPAAHPPHHPRGPRLRNVTDGGRKRHLERWPDPITEEVHTTAKA